MTGSIQTFSCLKAIIKPLRLKISSKYSVGFADNVRCFACSGGLRQWEAEDDPWLEHCRLFPECPIVKQRNGQRDIAYVHTPSVSEVDDLGVMNYKIITCIEKSSLVTK